MKNKPVFHWHSLDEGRGYMSAELVDHLGNVKRVLTTPISEEGRRAHTKVMDAKVTATLEEMWKKENC